MRKEYDVDFEKKIVILTFKTPLRNRGFSYDSRFLTIHGFSYGSRKKWIESCGIEFSSKEFQRKKSSNPEESINFGSNRIKIDAKFDRSITIFHEKIKQNC